MVPSIANGIVAQVNRELGPKSALANPTETRGGALLCRDDKLRMVAIVCYNGPITPIVRSVIREKVRGRGFTWLCNGQAGRNAIQVARWGEDHRYQPTAIEAAEGLKDLYGSRWAGMLSTGALKMPFGLRLSLAEIISASRNSKTGPTKEEFMAAVDQLATAALPLERFEGSIGVDHITQYWRLSPIGEAPWVVVTRESDGKVTATVSGDPSRVATTPKATVRLLTQDCRSRLKEAGVKPAF